MLFRPSFFFAIALGVSAGQTNRTCYDTTGNEASWLTQCDPEAATSSCCPFGQICYDNGLCQVPGVVQVNSTHRTQFQIHGCTDSNGDSDECLPFNKCKKIGLGLKSCDTNKYCCYGQTGCDCDNDKLVFSLPSGKATTTLPLDSGTSSTSVLRSTVTVEKDQGSATTKTTSTSSASASATSASSSNNTIEIVTGVAAGVGGIVFVLLLVGLGLWLWRRRRHQNQSQPPPYPNHDLNQMNYNPKELEASRGTSFSSCASPPAAYLPPQELDGEHQISQLDDGRRIQLYSEKRASVLTINKGKSRFFGTNVL